MSGQNPERDQAIVSAVLGGESMQSVANRYGLTRPRVSQIMSDWRKQREGQGA